MASSKESLLGVYMEHNRITEIPIWVGENYILSSFSVFSNDVSNIPAPVFNSLSNLQRLDISSNEMIKFDWRSIKRRVGNFLTKGSSLPKNHGF